MRDRTKEKVRGEDLGTLEPYLSRWCAERAPELRYPLAGQTLVSWWYTYGCPIGKYSLFRRQKKKRKPRQITCFYCADKGERMTRVRAADAGYRGFFSSRDIIRVALWSLRSCASEVCVLLVLGLWIYFYGTPRVTLIAKKPLHAACLFTFLAWLRVCFTAWTRRRNVILVIKCNNSKHLTV